MALINTFSISLLLTLGLVSGMIFPSGAEGADSVTESDLAFSITQFAKIDTGIYRGAQPDDKQFRLLKEFGIRTVINFRHEKEQIDAERTLVEDLGMAYISLPWRIQFEPRNPVMREYLREISKTSNGPFFIHCRRGADRTGVADALYRFYIKNEGKKEAWENARSGFDNRWIWKYFSKRRYKKAINKLGPREEFSLETVNGE